MIPAALTARRSVVVSTLGITQTLAVNHSALKYSVYDVITRTDARHGWVDKPFRIMNLSLGVPGERPVASDKGAAGRLKSGRVDHGLRALRFCRSRKRRRFACIPRHASQP